MMKHRYVAHILSCLLAVALAFSLAACGKTDDAQGAQTEGSQESGDTSQGGSKILIAYFTAAENSGVDTVSSAS